MNLMNQRKWIGFLGCSGMMLIFWAVPCVRAADGDLLWGDEGRPIVQAANNQHSFSAVSDQAGGVIVAWQDEISFSPLTNHVKAQRLDPLGEQMWNVPDGVWVTWKFKSESPVAVSDSAGGVIIAWQYLSGDGNAGIYCQRLNANGVRQWLPSGVESDVRVSSSAYADNTPVICADGTGGAYIGFGRRLANVNAAGTVTSPGIDGIEIIPAGMGSQFALTAGPNGIAYMAWTNVGNVYAQRVSPGLPWGAAPKLIAQHNLASCVQLSKASSNGILISWFANDGVYPGRTTLRIQALTVGGEAFWPAGGIVVLDSDMVGGDWRTYFSVTENTIAHDGAGGCIVAWEDYRYTPPVGVDADIYAQRVNSAGAIVWPTNGVLLPPYVVGSQAPGSQRSPKIVPDGWGGAVVAYQDMGGWSWDISATHLNANGTKLWSKWIRWDGSSSSDPGRSQKWPQLVYDDSGGIVVWVDTIGGSKADDLFAQKVQISPVPGNDACSDAQWITPGSHPGSTVYATPDGETICGNSEASPDVWFRYRPSQTTWVDLDTCQADFDTIISVHAGCPGGWPNTVLCNDDCQDARIGCTGTARSCARFAAQQNVDYLIRVSGYNGAKGDFVLTLSESGPLNDNCVDAIAVAEGVYTFSTVGATTDGPDEPTGCNFFDYTQIGSDTWYRYYASCTGQATVRLCGSSYDTKLAVYPNICTARPGHTLACSDDACGAQSEVIFSAQTGQYYMIRIGGYNGAQGWGILDISFTPADIMQDCVVNLNDFAVMAKWWLSQGCAPPTWCGRTDIDRNAAVDIADVVDFCEDWLVENLP